MLISGSLQLICDYGSANGIATLFAPGITDQADGVEDALTRLKDFGAALKTNNFTGANTGDCTISVKEVSDATAAPGAGVNAKEKLVFSWRKPGETNIRKGTISGLKKDCPHLQQEASGDRLSPAGRALLAGMLKDLYELEDDPIVFAGKAIEVA